MTINVGCKFRDRGSIPRVCQIIKIIKNGTGYLVLYISKNIKKAWGNFYLWDEDNSYNTSTTDDHTDGENHVQRMSMRAIFQQGDTNHAHDGHQGGVIDSHGLTSTPCGAFVDSVRCLPREKHTEDDDHAFVGVQSNHELSLILPVAFHDLLNDDAVCLSLIGWIRDDVMER